MLAKGPHSRRPSGFLAKVARSELLGPDGAAPTSTICEFEAEMEEPGALDEEEIRERMNGASDPSLPGALASEVQPQRLHWCWPGYLALGTLSDIQGDPGEGKSLIAVGLAASATTEREFPDGARGMIGNVLIVSAEDDDTITLRPRLEAAGADLSRVRLWTIKHGLPNLPRDLGKLEETIHKHKARLVILDPLDAFLGDKIDSNSNSSIRRVLIELARIAQRQNCALVVIRHLNKDSKVTNAMYRGAGSIGISAAARAVFLVGPAPDDREMHVLAPVKMNLVRKPPALGYRIVEAEISGPDGSPIKTQKIEWTGIVNLVAGDLLREPGEAARPGPKPEKRQEAEAFLRVIFKDGKEHPSKQ